MLAAHFCDRCPLDPPPCGCRAKIGVSRMPRRDLETDADQRQAQDERDAPAPHEELISRQRARGQDGKVGCKETGRDAELGPRRYEAAMLFDCRPFHGHQHRPTPFAADPDALDESQQRQHDCAPNADAGVRWHEADQNVATPISMRVAINVDLRPMRSPKWPKIAAPTGRAKKPTA